MPLTFLRNLGIVSAAGITTTKLGTGAVLQVVNVTYSTNVTSSSNVFADTGLTASITPSSASNKILVFVNCNGVDKFSGNTGSAFKLVRGATNIHNIESVGSYTNNSDENAIGSVSTCYLDSPSTASSTTYKITFSNFNNVGFVAINGNSVGGGTVSTMLLMEIAG